ncbi:hypothetical protein B0T24DRAFT_671248 [Lasiosphaeria ovina]|uniref:Uncharacterized protein n=1 Tax=Lasiosphaeria ovina TaxID=92902 RepID=A0AAE0JTF9_9PEZI|nr:hypothetical protein B0T24DRAFT_671248 [Lasiosphaeria ovina]
MPSFVQTDSVRPTRPLSQLRARVIDKKPCTFMHVTRAPFGRAMLCPPPSASWILSNKVVPNAGEPPGQQPSAPIARMIPPTEYRPLCTNTRTFSYCSSTPLLSDIPDHRTATVFSVYYPITSASHADSGMQLDALAATNCRSILSNTDEDRLKSGGLCNRPPPSTTKRLFRKIPASLRWLQQLATPTLQDHNGNARWYSRSERGLGNGRLSMSWR